MTGNYIIQGFVEKIDRVEKYDTIFKNLVVDGKYIHMAMGSSWSRDDIRIGDEVEVTCHDYTESESIGGNTYIVGTSVVFIDGEERDSKDILSPKEFAARMEKLAMNTDLEGMHSDMDDLMCETLKALGYEEGIEIFENTDKWYA